MNPSLQATSGPGHVLTAMRALLLSWCALAGLLMAPCSHAGTVYSLPAALTFAPFNCTLNSGTGTYECGTITLDKDTDLSLTANVTMWVKGGSFTSQKNLTTVNNGKTLDLSVDSFVSMQKDTDIDMNIRASGAVSFAKNAKIDGNITSSSNVTFAKDSTINGNLVVNGDLTGAKNVIVNGSCLVNGVKRNITCTGGTPTLHHVRVTYNGGASTCAKKSVTVTACAGADSSGSCTHFTGGLAGTLDVDSESDVALSSNAFTIGTGSHTVTLDLPVITSAQTVYFSFNGLSKVATTQGTCWNSGAGTNTCAMDVSSCGVHHLRLEHGGSGVTCVPADVTINACSAADSGGTCTSNTSGISGNLLAKSGGAVVATVPFSIPAGASAITKSVSVTTEQTVTFSTADWSVAPQNSDTCWTGSSTSCDYTFADSGFVFDVPNHLAGNTQAVTIKAVKKDATNSTAACQATLPDADVDVDFSCNYSDPSTGTQGASIGKSLTALSQTLTCNGSGTSKLNLHFTSGVSTLYLNYPDVGKVKLNASYTGANTGTILGNDFFTAAPTRFAIGVASSTALPLKADAAFDATVSAVNAAGAVTPNFAGSHIASLTFSQCGGAASGAFSGNLNSSGLIYVPSFTAGVGTVTGLKYSEVGRMDATATLVGSDYSTAKTFMDLGAGFGVTGTTDTVAGAGCSGSFGTFRPFRLVTTLEPTTTKFVYSGVPFNVRITARNASNNVTQNYTSEYATDIALSAIPFQNSVGTLTVGNAVPASAIVPAASFGTSAAGYATATPTYTFPAVTGGVNGAKLAPQSFYLRAVENSGASPASSASGGVPPPYEVKVLARYGRLRLFNVYGSSLASLRMPVQAEYWTGSVWVVNGDDSTTRIPAAAIGFPAGGDFTASAGTASDVTLVAGKGTIAVASSHQRKGYANVTVHLGNNSNTVATEKVNNSCLTAAAGLTGADMLGLRSYHGCGAGGYTYDPAARANFGVQSQETKGVVHVREVFN